MVEEALLNETERVSILQRTLAFIREVLRWGQFARPSGAPTQHYYVRCPRSSLWLDAQDESGPSQQRRGAEEEAGPFQAAPGYGHGLGQGRGQDEYCVYYLL